MNSVTVLNQNFFAQFNSVIYILLVLKPSVEVVVKIKRQQMAFNKFIL